MRAFSYLQGVLVYDAAGKLVAEYGSSAPLDGTQYLFSDQQGSPRAITGANGTVVSRHDYAPFGEEIGTVGMRTSGQGYGLGDNARQRYAGMEGDDATSMAHTLWRQYDSLAGRWTAPDPYGGSMSVASPQSFNRYTYVNNDPVNSVDPSGLMLSDIGVYQTEDAEQAKTLQRKSDADFKRGINADYATKHGGAVDYDKKGHAKFRRDANVIGVVTIYGHFEDIWGNPIYQNMVAALNNLATTGHHFGPAGLGGGVSSGGVSSQGGAGGPTFRGIHFGLSSMWVGGQVVLKWDKWGNVYASGGPTFGLSYPVNGGPILGGQAYKNGVLATSERDVREILDGPSGNVSFTGIGTAGGISGSWNTPWQLQSVGPPIPTGLNGTHSVHLGLPEANYSPQVTYRVRGIKF